MDVESGVGDVAYEFEGEVQYEPEEMMSPRC